ncbi:winged helix-turn-helix domain-containing protein [Streptomyces sp. 5-8]|uniref:Winged helix-turn-helix domain-containing protein n=1 Tax=Streptomyces musisoli TaxID=2802280 RepID=A0ABS1P6H7_9ACTN|nr:BTAD domain-containing putative transcriptional regulator [Streptomyces musisoli]MBL1107760.1 winged helix-turn-helix domain-containing protein [Streptomyces musisoli]
MRYRILGVAQAADDQGSALPLGGQRLRTLLAALALRPGRTTTPDTLIDEIWADDPPQDAPAALQALVGRLRRALGRHAVTSTPGGYRLEATEEDVDLHVFERLTHTGTTALTTGDPATAHRTLTEALSLWHGPALADLPDRTAATRPEALRLEATRARATAALALGRAQEAVPELRELTTAHPYDESLHVLLIRALRDTGRPADALAAYESARRTLADTLGTDPGPELQALHASLLKQEAPAPPAPPARPAPVPCAPRPERSGNLRPRLTSFVGREPELEAIRSDLHRARLVTLTGPGGSGKTRLAEEAAAALPSAWLIELAPLDRPEAVPGAVVSALGLRETALLTNELATSQADPTALLIEYCAARSQLLILDNCEHVIDAAAALAETLLTRCPGLTILATSREPLGVAGESVRPVEPLVPEQAHRLFTERAQAVRPDADAVLGDTVAVAEICRRLDGLPLAIELAAARLRLLTPRQIADRLDDRFRLLTSGSRTVLPRQQTLRAVVDWSWDLLDEQERTVLREVSVFAGGWDLVAAEAVCTGPAADLIGALVDKSLVVAAPDGTAAGSGMRYRMLETIHEYATERAAETPGLRAAAERRHRAWARSLVEEAEPQLRSAAQLPWFSRLETELDNIRAALDRAVRAGDEAEAAAVVLAIGWFWWLRNHRQEGVAWVRLTLRLGVALDTLPAGTPAAGLRAAVDRADPVGAFLADPDGQAGHPLAELRTDLRMLDLFLTSESNTDNLAADERAPEYIARLRAAYERGGAPAARFPGIVWPLTTYYLGGPVDIRPVMAQAVANARRHGDDWEIGVALMYRAHVTVDSPGNLRGVDEDLAELRLLSRRVGDRWMRAQVCSAAGEAAMARGRFDEARGEYEEALRLAYEVGASAEAPFLLARLAEISYRRGDRKAAMATLDEAETAADRFAVPESRAFVLLLRALISLHDGETARSRELYEATRAAVGGGTPPPQFVAVQRTVEGLLAAAESGPAHGLPIMADALREATAHQCAESITAGLLDVAAGLLARLGELPGAIRLFAAADHWREGRRRPEPERTVAARVRAGARAALPADRYAAECARGASLGVADVLRELGAATAGAGGRPGAPAAEG